MYIPDVRRRDSVPLGPRSKESGVEQGQRAFSVSHVTTHNPNDFVSSQNHYFLLAWIINIIPSIIPNDASTSSPARFLSSTNSNSLGKRADDTSPNTTTSVVAGILVTAFVILAGIFLYVYRRSIRFRQARKRRRHHHHHRRRPSGVSKMSQGSDAVPGAGDGGVDGGAPAVDAAPAEP